MQPFAVRDADAAAPTHTPGLTCPACIDGYPQPCLRITGQGFQPVSFDDVGHATELAWKVDRCPGDVHAVTGAGGILETRCSACGVPP